MISKRRLREWCEKVTELTGESWSYAKILQDDFERLSPYHRFSCSGRSLGPSTHISVYPASSILAATQAIVEAPMLRTRSSMVYLGWCNGNLGFLSETTLAKELAEIDANPGEPAKSVPEPHEDSH